MTHDLIEEVTFENCTLVGPAVIALLGEGTFRDSAFDGDPDGVLWPLGDRRHVIGAVGLLNCTVIGCRLQRIGLAYAADQEEAIRAGFGLSG